MFSGVNGNPLNNCHKKLGQSEFQVMSREDPEDNTKNQEEEHDKPLAREYDDLFQYVSSFGRYQKKVFFSSCCLVMMTSMQFAALLFVFGTPNFHCDTPVNSTCPSSKCCDNCTSYVFDGPFQSVVSEVIFIKVYIVWFNVYIRDMSEKQREED